MEVVPLEIAKKLKEKGFKEKCLAYYDIEDNVGLLYNTQYGDEYSPCQYTDLLQSHNTDTTVAQPDDSENCCDAPVICQVLKWLREVKQIEVNAAWDNKESKWFGYANGMNKPDLVGYHISLNNYDFYEQAALAGIEHVLDNLI